MSHFIATSITFSKDKTTFTVRGGDNNVAPRPNHTLDNISIDKLFFEVAFGNIQFTQGNIKGYIITQVANRLEKEYGGTWDDGTDMYHEHYLIDKNDAIRIKIASFNKRFLEEIFSDMKTSGDKYVVAHNNEQYIQGLKRGGAYITETIEKAQRYNLARAKQIASRFNNFSPLKVGTL